jgi:hypothetical protein
VCSFFCWIWFLPSFFLLDISVSLHLLKKCSFFLSLSSFPFVYLAIVPIYIFICALLSSFSHFFLFCFFFYVTLTYYSSSCCIRPRTFSLEFPTQVLPTRICIPPPMTLIHLSIFGLDRKKKSVVSQYPPPCFWHKRKEKILFLLTRDTK